MVEPDNIFAQCATLALDSDKFLRIDVVTVVRRVIPSVPRPRDASHSLRSVICKLPQQHSAALMGICFFAVLTKRGANIVGNRKHLREVRSEKSDCRSKSRHVQRTSLAFHFCNLTSEFCNSFLLLVPESLAQAAVGWFRRRRWGWILGTSIIAVNALGDLVNLAIGEHLKGTVGVIIAGLLLVYMTRPRVRNYFKS